MEKKMKEKLTCNCDKKDYFFCCKNCGKTYCEKCAKSTKNICPNCYNDLEITN